MVFKLDPAGSETVLNSFQGSDGANPGAGVIRDPAGNFYGTTFYGAIPGGSCNFRGCGVVFKLSPDFRETIRHSFTGGTDGGYPSAVIRDASGNLHGTTQVGGAFNQGVVYQVDTDGNYTVLYSFTGGTDGGRPRGPVIRDSAGNLYGLSFGANYAGTCEYEGCTVVFRLDPTGNRRRRGWLRFIWRPGPRFRRQSLSKMSSI